MMKIQMTSRHEAMMAITDVCDNNTNKNLVGDIV